MTFKISCNWLDRAPTRRDDELEATLAALRIFINGKNVTAYNSLAMDGTKPRTEPDQDKLHIPAYFIAEWISENWWPLRYEPRKSENGDDASFRSRHSILNAQHGFALPDVQIEPLGDAIGVSCRPHEAHVAGVKFRNGADARISRKTAEGILQTFVKDCIGRLDACEVTGTPLQRAWRDIEQTDEAQLTFCKLAGALGINPYAASSELADAIDKIFDAIGERAAFDLCLASAADQIIGFDRTATFIARKFQEPHTATLAPLSHLQVKPDKISLPSWYRGKAAALNVRSLLDIKPGDQSGADKLFDNLKISTDMDNQAESDEAVFSGAVDRVESRAKFILLQSQEENRRFAASRAVLLALISEPHSRRLVTDAITRDQQASRAFAAEILVPLEYLKSQARRRKLSRDQVHEIARQRRASVDVVQYQAINSGMIIEASIQPGSGSD